MNLKVLYFPPIYVPEEGMLTDVLFPTNPTSKPFSGIAYEKLCEAKTNYVKKLKATGNNQASDYFGNEINSTGEKHDTVMQ